MKTQDRTIRDELITVRESKLREVFEETFQDGYDQAIKELKQPEKQEIEIADEILVSNCCKAVIVHKDWCSCCDRPCKPKKE